MSAGIKIVVAALLGLKKADYSGENDSFRGPSKEVTYAQSSKWFEKWDLKNPALQEDVCINRDDG